MDDQDLVRIHDLQENILLNKYQGVVLCVTSLVMALAQDNLDAFAVCYTKAVDRLYHVSELANTFQSTDLW